MALVLTGIMNGMRPVGGIIEKGSRQGETWAFLSMEIADPRYGRVYSCQMRSQDKLFKDYVEVKDGKDDQGKPTKVYTLKKDLIDHKVKVTITSMTAGDRDITDKETGEVRTIAQIRTQVTNLKDLGEPKDDDE